MRRPHGICFSSALFPMPSALTLILSFFPLILPSFMAMAPCFPILHLRFSPFSVPPCAFQGLGGLHGTLAYFSVCAAPASIAASVRTFPRSRVSIWTHGRLSSCARWPKRAMSASMPFIWQRRRLERARPTSPTGALSPYGHMERVEERASERAHWAPQMRGGADIEGEREIEGESVQHFRRRYTIFIMGCVARCYTVWALFSVFCALFCLPLFALLASALCLLPLFAYAFCPLSSALCVLF